MKHYPLSSIFFSLVRYILDNKQAFQHKRVLDVGSGCGASAIACAMVGASTVTANDICPGEECLLYVYNFRVKFQASHCHFSVYPLT